VPFLDHLVFEAAAGMPEKAKREKAILREAAARVLPPDVTGRRKHGFTVPVGAWLRGELRPLLDELLAPSRLRAQGIWKAAQVEGWCRQHLEGSVDRARQLWNLLAVQLWWEEALR
jgi:asparagine synthase (glutamine-hydrolysing)